MRIDVHFYGCSCGCTPGDYATFEGEAPDIYVAIAEWAEGYRTEGDPFRKLIIPEEAKPYVLKYIELDGEVGKLLGEIRDLEAVLTTRANKKSSYLKAADLLGIALPQHIFDDIQKIDGSMKEPVEKIAKLKEEMEAACRRRDAVFSCHEKAWRMPNEGCDSED